MTIGTVSNRIRDSRKKQRLTQQELADSVGVSLMTVLRWEKGERTPNTSVMPRLSEVLNVSASYLMGLEESPERSEVGIDVPSVKEKTQERNMNMAAITLDNGNKIEAPATPEGYAFLEKIFMMSMGGKAVALAG